MVGHAVATFGESAPLRFAGSRPESFLIDDGE
jgi:hypothetical protein